MQDQNSVLQPLVNRFRLAREVIVVFAENPACWLRPNAYRLARQTCLHCAHLIGIFAEFDLDRNLITRIIFRLLPKKGTSNTKERIELLQRKFESIRILKHGRKAKSIFRYGLDIVTEFLLRGRNEYNIPIFDFLTVANQILSPD